MKMYQEALQMISFLSSIIITDAGHLIVAIYGPRCVYVFCMLSRYCFTNCADHQI